MRVHFLNCVSTCPLGGLLMDGESKRLRGRLTCTSLLVERPQGLILIDTGFGTRDVVEPRSRLSPFFLGLLRPELREEMTALRQVEALGFARDDVRDIVLTHLDFDHAGGLDDFPEARVHLMRKERDAALTQDTWLDRQRYRPQQWSRRDKWIPYTAGEGEPWFDFDAVRQLHGLPPEILLVPLIGHTLGHTGVAVSVGERWLLNAGDAYFFHREVDVRSPRCPPGLGLYQTMMEKNRAARLWNQKRLRDLRRDHPGEIEVFCSHDVKEFERHAGRPATRPAGRWGAGPALERGEGAPGAP